MERREAILGVLCRERQETIKGLMTRFRVSRNTIKADIEILSCTYPIKTVRGKYGGGIYLEGEYRPDRRQLSSAQLEMLRRVLPKLEGEDLYLMKAVIAQFGPAGNLL